MNEQLLWLLFLVTLITIVSVGHCFKSFLALTLLFVL